MKIAITGATSGIGKQLALDYLHEGHEVWAIGRNREALADLATSGLHTARLDLTDRAATLEWFRTLASLDIAILNAGSCEYMDLPEFDSELFSRVMRTNLESMAICIEGVLPLLRQGQSPLLVLVGSSAAYVPLSRAEAYGASKAAIAYLADTLRVDLYRERIDVSLVCPGFVKTPLTDRNDFPMPARVSVEDASRYIRQGIKRRNSEIHFPKRFTYLLKALSLLPTWLWTRLSQRMIQHGK